MNCGPSGASFLPFRADEIKSFAQLPTNVVLSTEVKYSSKKIKQLVPSVFCYEVRRCNTRSNLYERCGCSKATRNEKKIDDCHARRSLNNWRTNLREVKGCTQRPVSCRYNFSYNPVVLNRYAVNELI